MNLTVQTCTPIWTGAVKTGRMDRIHETNIVGSLRWWYEAIVRGLGGEVCNPTSDNPAERCPQNDGSYCDVCRIFGATGLRRTFRLRMGTGTYLFNDSTRSIPLPSGRIHQNRREQYAAHRRLRTGGWYLMGESMIGDAVPLEIIPLSSDYKELHLRLVLTLVDRHTAIGAKVSNGYGVVSMWENNQRVRVTNEDLDSLTQVQSQPSRYHTLPDIRDFFFAKVRFEEPMDNPNWWQQIRGIAEAWSGRVSNGGQRVYVHRSRQEHQQAKRNLDTIVQNGLLPMAPAVRNWLRYEWSSHLNDCQKYYLFGEVQPVCPRCCQKGFRQDKNNRENNWCPNCGSSFPKGDEFPEAASKINVSHAYRLDNGQWELRIWGWIPCQSPEGITLDRDDFLQTLQAALNNAVTWQWIFNADHPTPQITEWHMLACDQTDGVAYLKELLGLGEGGAQ